MSRYEVELILKSGKNIKNVNWRYGPTRPYAVVWVDSDRKVSTKVDEEDQDDPTWDQTLVIPLPPGASIEETTLYIDVVHHGLPEEEDTKPLIGSAKLKLHEVAEEVGIGAIDSRKLKLKRPSGRPHGKLDFDVTIKEIQIQYHPPPNSYGTREYVGEPAYGAPPPQGGYSPYGAPPPTAYGQPDYGHPVYGQQPVYYVEEEKKKGSSFGGMGTGLAVGVVAGAVGAVAVMEGYDALEDHIAAEAAEKVEEDRDDGDDDGGW